MASVMNDDLKNDTNMRNRGGSSQGSQPFTYLKIRPRRALNNKEVSGSWTLVLMRR